MHQAKRIEVRERSIAIPIHEFSGGRFCADTTHGGNCKGISRTSLNAAKAEAQKLIVQIALEGSSPSSRRMNQDPEMQTTVDPDGTEMQGLVALATLTLGLKNRASRTAGLWG